VLPRPGAARRLERDDGDVHRTGLAAVFLDAVEEQVRAAAAVTEEMTGSKPSSSTRSCSPSSVRMKP
jgi:hypothetical protein